MPNTKESMANTYFIGDLQGCADQLQTLISKIEQISSNNYYIFAGDLVNRGPKSLETLRLVRKLQQTGQAESVLGNHDLHLLAVANGIRPAHRNDTVEEILIAPDRDELLHWLRQRPLAIFKNQHLVLHAGVFPSWSAEQTMALAHEVETKLKSPAYTEFLADMYGNTPDTWSDDLTGNERLRCIVNALTRMRFCTEEGKMDFATKDGLAAAPEGFAPWFDVDRATTDCTVVFGHWSTLGLLIKPDLISLDTGCVWGGKLTAVSMNGRQIIQIDCPQRQKPG